MENKELIWVPADVAKKYKKFEDEKTQGDIIIQYMDEAKMEYMSYIETLDDDVISFKGSMARIKKAFRGAKDEQLAQSYELWEEFEEEIPAISNKIDKTIEKINPLINKVDQMKIKLNSIDTFKLEKILDIIKAFNMLDNQSRKMFSSFLSQQNEDE